LGVILKIWAPLRKLFAHVVSQAGYVPALRSSQNAIDKLKFLEISKTVFKFKSTLPIAISVTSALSESP